MKHAYLILAHNEWRLLQTLISCIDDERNDIYVHIDAKVKDLPELISDKAGLTILENRVDVRWGDISVMEAECALFAAAFKPGEYAYYHLLSGCDLPIKSQDYIHDFCERNSGKEFIGYTLSEMNPELIRKVCRWHLFPKEFREKKRVKRYLRAFFLKVQELIGYRRNKDIDFKKGSQWVSITERMIHILLENLDWMEKHFTHTFCCDEIVVQTLAWKYAKESLYNEENDGEGCMRAIGWKGCTLIEWNAADYDELASSPALFARKFNSSDWEFIEKIIALSR